MLQTAHRVSMAPQAPPPPRDRDVTVTALLDATARDIAPNVLHTLADFQDAAERVPSAHITAQATSAGTTAASLKRRAWMTRAVPYTLGALGLGTAGLTAVAAGGHPLISAGLALSTMAGTWLLRRKLAPTVGKLDMDAAKFAQLVPVPQWKGRQTFHLQADRPLAASSPAHQRADVPDAPAFCEQLLADMKAYPGARHVVYVFGHGLGFHRMARMKISELAAGLERASQQSGEKIDALVGQSCLMGNLETLAWLPNAVQTAVVSEPNVNIETYQYQDGHLGCDRAYDWPSLLLGLTTTRDVGGMFLSDIGGEADNMMSAVNLADMRSQLMPALDTLGHALCGEMARGRKAAIQQALKNTAVVDKESRYRDLGGFLDALQHADVRPDTRVAARDARAALEACVRVMRTGDEKQTEHLSGLSFQASARTSLDYTGWKAWLMGVDHYDHYRDVPLPANWKKFIAAL
jgi:hypothetical protein